MIKAEIPGWFLMDWFLKSLRPEICKDATMMGAQTKEEEILRMQQLNLIYSQSSMLYKILPNAPHVEIDPTKETPNPHVRGVIGSVVVQVTSLMGKVAL